MKTTFTNSGVMRNLFKLITLTTFLTLTIPNAWGADEWVKVTSAPASWAGEYLLVYEKSATSGYVWTGVDAAPCYASATISSGKISAIPSGGTSLTIAAVTGGYSIKINSGTNSGKYIGKSNDANGMDIGASAVKNVLSYESSSVKIVGAGGAVLRYNASSGQDRFRYYKSSSYTGQKAIQLYKKTSSGFTVTYNGNGNTGGSVPTDATAYSSGATVTVKGNTGSLVKTNYTFDGWNTAADGSGTAYVAGETFTISANTTLYAQWTCSAKLTVNLNTPTHGTYVVHKGNNASGPVVSDGDVLDNCSGLSLYIVFTPEAGYGVTSFTVTSNGVQDPATAYITDHVRCDYSAGTKTTNITVTFGKACATPTISFPTAAITKYWGDGKFTFAPTITGNDLEADVTYSSNKTSCATVNATTGEVTIVNATGSGSPVTITATLAAATDGDDCQNSVSASYTITIYNKVTWLINGEETTAGGPTTYTNEGGTITGIPTDPDGDAVCSGKTFVGWTTSVYTGDVAPSPLYTSVSDMSSVHITDNTTYYAVFAEGSGGGGGGGSSDYVLVESDLGTNWAGDYLIAYSPTVFADGRTGGTAGMGAKGASVNPDTNLDGKVVAASWGDTYHVTLEEISEGSNTYLLKTQDGKYNYQTSNNNGLATSTNPTTAANYPITVTFNSSEDIALGISSGVIFHYNSGDNGYFRFYKNGGQNAVYLYKKGSGGGGGSYSDYSTTCGNCLAAPEPVVTARTDNAILSWAAVEGATGYTVTCSGGTVVVSGTTATITGLTSETEYTYSIQSVGPNPPYECFKIKNGSFTTPGATIDVVEWQENAAVIYVDKEEGVNPLVIIDGEVEHGSISGSIATDLFFSKYFEGAGSMKLIAIFNGTGKDISLKNYKIVDKHVNSSGVYGTPVVWELETLGKIKAGQEIIFFTRPKSTGAEEKLDECSTSFLSSVSGKSGENENPRWIECDNAPFSKMEFNGNDAMILQKSEADIDIIGSYALANLSSNCWGESSWGGTIKNMDYGKTAGDYPNITLSGSETMLDYGVDLTNETISAYTARCILFRNSTVTSGEKAVALNETDFVTLSAHTYLGESYESEWYGRSVCVSQSRCDALGWTFVADSDGKTYRDNSAATCNSYQDLGEFDYNSYYTEYENISEDTYLDSYSHNPETGEYTIPIDNLAQYSCLSLRFQLKQGETVLTENAVQVPIIVKGAKTTADAIFNEIVEDKETHAIQYDKSIERCQTCNVVVLGNATLTKATDGATHDVPQIRDLTIYPGGKLVVPSSTNYTVHSLALRRQEDAISLADIKGNLSVDATNGVYFDLRIDPTNWHYITLPYDCNFNDITFSDGTTAELGKDYQIAWYDGAYRAANKDGGWTDVTAGTTLKKGLGYIVCLPGAGKVRKELRFPMANGVIAAEKANKTVSYVYAYGGDQSDEDLRPNHKGWNLLGNPYMMYYNTDITTPLKTGTLEQDTEDPNLWVLNTTGAKNVRYLVEPINNGWSGYRQIPITTHMPPFTSYFVQVGGANPATAQSVSFNVAKSGLSNIVARREAAEDIEDNHPVWYGLQLLAPNNEKDNTTLLISDDFTDDYDMMDDLVKMRGSYYKYYNLPILSSRNNEGEMAFNALPDQSAAVVGVPLTYYAAQAGTYTFMTDGQFDLEEVKSAFLFDVTTNQYYDLLTDNYSFETAKGNNEDRFRLFVAVERQKAPDIVTDDNLLDEGQLSLTSIDHTLLLSGLTGMADIYVYDMSGKLLRSESVKNQNGVWRTPVSLPGVYFVRVNNALGQQTLRAIVK